MTTQDLLVADDPRTPFSPSLDFMFQEDFEYVTYPEPKLELCGGWPVPDPMSLPRNRAPRMAWGRYRGRRVEQLPLDYLFWLEQKGIALQGEMREAVEQRLGHKLATVDRRPAGRPARTTTKPGTGAAAKLVAALNSVDDEWLPAFSQAKMEAARGGVTACTHDPVDEPAANGRVRQVCRLCGRFYGYKRDEVRA